MLSLSDGGMTASQAGKYFATEDYYLKGGESSRWLGKGAVELKLSGQVGEKEFRNVCAGKSPDGAAQLVAPKITRKEGEPQEAHRAGNDLTFSAPKSLSIGYAAGNHELKEIWDQAVENTMRYVEDHYSQYRTPGGIQNSGSLLAAKFDHVTSRALDPDVHSHVFLLNMVPMKDGGWRANEPRSIYRDKISIGMLARQEAIYLLREAGYQIYFTDREKFLFEIEGVTKEEIEFFSKRSAAIGEQVAQWMRERKFIQVKEALKKQWASLDTRNWKFKVTQLEIRQKWAEWFVELGTSAQQVLERIEITRLRGLEKGSEFRYLAPADYPRSLASVVTHTNLAGLKRQAGFDAAKKHGDFKAAVQIVDAVVKREYIEGIRSLIPENSKIYIIPVAQRETNRLNMLPAAYARKLAKELGGEVWTGIAKVSGKSNTGASLDERLKNLQIFRGELPPENSILIIADDTFTSGGTVTALIDHLAQGGRTPLCVTTLAFASYQKGLIPTKDEINGLLRKTGLTQREFESEFGYSPRFLTGAEIRSYLHRGRGGIDGARARFYSSGVGTGLEGYGRAGREGAGESPQTVTTPTTPQKTALEVLKEASSFLTDKEVIFDRAQLIKTAVQISGGEHDIRQIEAALNDKREFHFLGQEPHGQQPGKDFFTTREMLKLEAQNIETLKDLPRFIPVTSKAEVEAYLKGLAGAGEGSLTPEESGFKNAFKAGAASAAPTGFVNLTPGQKSYVLNEAHRGKGIQCHPRGPRERQNLRLRRHRAVQRRGPGTDRKKAPGDQHRVHRQSRPGDGKGERK